MLNFFGGHCGPPYTESMDHEFEGNPGVPPGGVVDETGYCKHCGVHQSMHGGDSAPGSETPGAEGGGGGGAPPEPPYWHGHSWQPTGVEWDEAAGQFSDGSPPTGPGGGPWKGSVIHPGSSVPGGVTPGA